MVGKAVGFKKASKILNKFLINTNILDKEMPYGFLLSGNIQKNINNYLNDFAYELDGKNKDNNVFRLGCTIGTHVGPGVVGIAFLRNN